MNSSSKFPLSDAPSPPKGLGWFRAACTIVMSCVGVGILALPGTGPRSGWLGCIIGFTIAATIVFYCNLLLWRTLRLAAEGECQVVRSYEQAGRASFGIAASIYIGFIIHITLGSVCCAMLILMGSTCQSMTHVLDKRTWIALWTLVGIPFSWIKEIKDVGFVAAVGVLSASTMVIVIIAASADRMVADGIPQDLIVGPRSAIDFLSTLATYFFVNGFAASTPTVCYHMNNPMEFPKTLIVAMIFIAFVYVTVMELGYVGYGQFLSNVDTIVNAISPSGEPLDVFGWLINLAVLIVMLPHYLVMFTPTAKQLDVVSVSVSDKRQWSAFQSKLLCLVARTCLVVLEGFIAIVVPKVSSIVSLIGAFCMIQFTIFFPVACYHKLRKQRQLSASRWEILLQVFLVAIGFVVMVTGLYGAVTRF